MSEILKDHVFNDVKFHNVIYTFKERPTNFRKERNHSKRHT